MKNTKKTGKHQPKTRKHKGEGKGTETSPKPEGLNFKPKVPQKVKKSPLFSYVREHQYSIPKTLGGPKPTKQHEILIC